MVGPLSQSTLPVRHLNKKEIEGKKGRGYYVRPESHDKIKAAQSFVDRKLYPRTLGLNQKNSLNSKGGQVSLGRWVNINHLDWDNPKWVKVECWGWLIDRALGGKNYTLFEQDYAIMTLYLDPVEEMPIYDMLPIHSPLFDMVEKPGNDLEELYSFANVEGIGDIQLRNFRPIAPIPLLAGAVGVLLLIPPVLGMSNK